MISEYIKTKKIDLNNIEILKCILPVVVEAGLKILYCYRTLPSPFLGPCLVCAYRCVHFLAAEILRFLTLMVELAEGGTKTH